MVDSVLRRLARDHWVRLHGTPRVTVLVGGDRGREIWTHWLAVAGFTGTLLEGAFEDRIREAVAAALERPRHPIAVLVSAEDAARWRAGRRDRLAALVDEGWIIVDERRRVVGGESDDAVAGDARDVAGAVDAPVAVSRRPGGPGGPGTMDARVGFDARSAAEVALYQALEATPATAGRFALNESLAVRFGPAAAEIDLLSRGDRIAIEIDGVHHFADLECYRRDRRKDLLLQTQGFVVVRLLAEDVVRDVRAAVNTVCQALAYRRERAR